MISSLFPMVLALLISNSVGTGKGNQEIDTARKDITKLLKALFNTELEWLKENKSKASIEDGEFEAYCQEHFSTDKEAVIGWFETMNMSESHCASKLYETITLVKIPLAKKIAKTDGELTKLEEKMKSGEKEVEAEGYKEFKELLVKATKDGSGTSSGQRAPALMTAIAVILYCMN